VAASADAVVVGSALIAKMEQKAHSAEGLEEIQIHGAAVQLLHSIRAGVDSSPS
jgi:tryptophan synthase alpha subunit